MLKEVEKITVKNLKTGEVIAVISDTTIITATPEIVVVLTPKKP